MNLFLFTVTKYAVMTNMTNFPHRNRERFAGALFLLVFALYGGGAALLTAPLETPDLFTRLAEFSTSSAFGGALVAANSLAVVVIAAALYPVLAAQSVPLALGYVAARMVESILLAAGATCLLTVFPAGLHLAREAGAHNAAISSAISSAMFSALRFALQEMNNTLYQFAMLALGVGSVGFCRTLLRARLLPKAFAFAGIAGYIALAVGATLELFGVKAGIILAAPGGVFEFALGIWLLWKGFNSKDFAAENPQVD